MKKLFVIVLCMLFALGCFAGCGSKQTTDAVRLCTLSTKNGEITNSYNYDENGNLIEWYIPVETTRHLFEYDENGQMLRHSILIKEREKKRFDYKYDGTVLTEKTAILLNDGKEIQNRVYKYSYDGQNCTEKIYYKNGVEKSRTLFKYNAEGRVIEETEYIDGSNVPHKKYRYENGLQVESVEYRPEGTVKKHSIVKNGFEEKFEYTYNGELWQSVTGEYDDRGNVISSLFYSHGKTVKTYSWKYNSNGQVIEETNYSNDGKPSIITVQKYDENGNNIETFEDFKDLNKTQRTVRKFDENGIKLKEHTTYETIDGKWSKSSEYNAETDEIIKISYKADGTESSRTVYKQKEGKTVQETSYHEGVEQNSTKHYYDAYGNLLKTEYVKKGKVTTTVEYQYIQKSVPKEQVEKVRQQKYAAKMNGGEFNDD